MTDWGPHVSLPFHTSVATSTYSSLVDDYLILADASGGAFTVNLPAAAANPGRVLCVKKTDASANAVTIDGSGSELIEDATTQALLLQGECLMLQCDTTKWRIL